MNPARYVDWTSPKTHEALLRYFGLRYGEPSRYRMRQLFHAEMLGDWNSVQMHEVGTQDGCFIRTEMGGAPAHKAAFEARLDGIPAEFFDWPMQYLREKKPDLFDSACRIWDRGCFDNYADIAAELNITDTGLRKRADYFIKALVKVIAWADWGSKWQEGEEAV